MRLREAPAYDRLEDSWFARDVAALGLGIVVTDAALSQYNVTSGIAIKRRVP